LLNRSQFAIGQWIDLYRRRGLDGLLHLNYRGGNLAPSIPVEIQCQLKEKLAQPEGFPVIKPSKFGSKDTGVGSPIFNRFGTVKYRLTSKFLDRMRLITIQKRLKNLKKNGACQSE